MVHGIAEVVSVDRPYSSVFGLVSVIAGEKIFKAGRHPLRLDASGVVCNDRDRGRISENL